MEVKRIPHLCNLDEMGGEPQMPADYRVSLHAELRIPVSLKAVLQSACRTASILLFFRFLISSQDLLSFTSIFN